MGGMLRLAGSAVCAYFGMLLVLPAVAVVLVLGFLSFFGLAAGGLSLAAALALGDGNGIRAGVTMLGGGAVAFVGMCVLFNAAASGWSKLRGPRDEPFLAR